MELSPNQVTKIFLRPVKNHLVGAGQFPKVITFGFREVRGQLVNQVETSGWLHNKSMDRAQVMI